MKLKDMIDKLRIPCQIKIRDSENNPICDCESNSKGVIPYLHLEVAEWFVYGLGDVKNTICVLVNDVREETENETDRC